MPLGSCTTAPSTTIPMLVAGVERDVQYLHGELMNDVDREWLAPLLGNIIARVERAVLDAQGLPAAQTEHANALIDAQAGGSVGAGRRPGRLPPQATAPPPAGPPAPIQRQHIPYTSRIMSEEQLQTLLRGLTPRSLLPRPSRRDRFAYRTAWFEVARGQAADWCECHRYSTIRTDLLTSSGSMGELLWSPVRRLGSGNASPVCSTA